MTDTGSSHDEFIRQLRRQYQQEGFEEKDKYDVVTQLGIGYEPDLVFERGNEMTIIQIEVSNSTY